jgi:hypothetical protein
VVGYAAGGFSQDGDFGDSEYNALQVALRHSFSHGLQLQGAYSYGRVFTDMTGVEFHGSGGTLTSNDPANFAQQHGAADFNRPHRFVLSYAYSLPAYHGGKGLAGKALSGFGLAGVTTVQSGLPMTLTDPSGGAVYGFAGASRAQLCPGITYANLVNPGGLESKLGSYFNLNAVADTVVTGATAAAKAACPFPVLGAFASPGPGAPASTGATGYGNAGRSILFGPGQVNWDVSVRKHTRVGGLSEDGDLELRADFFNAFNHAQFSNPATNVNAGSFGVISSTVVGPRIIQLGIKYLF